MMWGWMTVQGAPPCPPFGISCRYSGLLAVLVQSIAICRNVGNTQDSTAVVACLVELTKLKGLGELVYTGARKNILMMPVEQRTRNALGTQLRHEIASICCNTFVSSPCVFKCAVPHAHVPETLKKGVRDSKAPPNFLMFMMQEARWCCMEV
ncbi:hypothetical protein BC827DRAFT_1202428, partial [Russula dissimulans]